MEILMISVLFIDDEPEVLGLMQEALTFSEVEVLTASDPAVGLDIALKRRPQTVFLDLLMPTMGGMQVLEQLLAQDPGSNSPQRPILYRVRGRGNSERSLRLPDQADPP